MSRIQNQTGTKTFIQYNTIIEITYMYGVAFRNIQHTKNQHTLFYILSMCRNVEYKRARDNISIDHLIKYKKK